MYSSFVKWANANWFRKVSFGIFTLLVVALVVVADQDRKMPDVVSLRAAIVPDRVVMLGDSITARGNWGVLLPEVRPYNYGIGSNYTDSVLERLDTVIEAKPQKVFLMIGINDVYREDDPLEIYDRYRQIVDRLLPHSEVVLQSTLFPGKEEDVDQRQVVAVLNELLKEFAQKRGLDFIDLNREMNHNQLLAGHLTDDGIHLSSEGYAAWTKVLREYLQASEHIVASTN